MKRKNKSHMLFAIRLSMDNLLQKLVMLSSNPNNKPNLDF